MDRGLTPEQECFANHGEEAFVMACPGAGKTRTIVERLARIAKTLPPRRGVAILSFTNTAVEHFAESCETAHLGAYLRFPNFTGTFDAFVRRFLVLPSGIDSSASRPIVVDSWDSLGIEIRLTGAKAFAGPGVCLDDFDPGTNSVDPERIGMPALRKHVLEHKEDYEIVAKRRRSVLHRAGYLSTADARVEAVKRIRNPLWKGAVGRALASRFCELVVDEAQDCNPLDLAILSWLRGYGLRVTVVCDPDQSIYEFREGSPSALLEFAETYRCENRLSFTGNFRSSKAICALAATLRGREVPDTALGEASVYTYPVIVATYHGNIGGQIGRLFTERIESKVVGLSRKDGILLAHRHADALRASGVPVVAKTAGASRIEAVARSVAEFWSPSATAGSRESAVRAMEKLLLTMLGQWKEGEDHSPIRVIERANLNRRELRRQALDLLMHIPRTCDNNDGKRAKWVEAVRARIDCLGLTLPPGVTARKFLCRIGKGEWSKHLREPADRNVACSTIHDAKGREYEAVCVVLRPDRAQSNRTSELFDAWETRADLEPKRVIYVGVTRARRLVLLAVPEAFGGRCVGILEKGGVPHERVQLL